VMNGEQNGIAFYDIAGYLQDYLSVSVATLQYIHNKYLHITMLMHYFMVEILNRTP